MSPEQKSKLLIGTVFLIALLVVIYTFQLESPTGAASGPSELIYGITVDEDPPYEDTVCGSDGLGFSDPEWPSRDCYPGVYVPDAHKTAYNLDPTCTNYEMDYETAGLPELQYDDTCNEKCQDCCEDPIWSPQYIMGIVTEYDPISVSFNGEINPEGDFPLSDYSAIVSVGSATKTINLGTCDIIDYSGVDYFLCTVDFTVSELSLNRGTAIQATVELDGPNEVSCNIGSNSIVVAKYNLFTISSTGETIWQDEIQYSNFSELSDLNKEIQYAGKPVYVEKSPPSLDLTVLGICPPVVDTLKDPTNSYVAGFDSGKDTLLVYEDSWLPAGTTGSWGCPVGYSDDDGFNIEIIGDASVAQLPLVAMATSATTPQKEYILSHELGHRYGNFGEEYNSKAWYRQKLMGINNNARDEFGDIAFPIGCRTYVCCELNPLFPGFSTNYYWYPSWKCTSGTLTMSATVKPDATCVAEGLGPKPKDKNAVDSSGSYIYGDYGSSTSCPGTPHDDVDGTVPHSAINLSTDSTSASSYYWSVMGYGSSGNYARTYPEDASCPLKC